MTDLTGEAKEYCESLVAQGVDFVRLNVYGGDDQSYFETEYPSDHRPDHDRDWRHQHEAYPVAEQMLDYIPNAGSGYLYGFYIIVNAKTAQAVVEAEWSDERNVKPRASSPWDLPDMW